MGNLISIDKVVKNFEISSLTVRRLIKSGGLKNWSEGIPNAHAKFEECDIQALEDKGCTYLKQLDTVSKLFKEMDTTYYNPNAKLTLLQSLEKHAEFVGADIILEVETLSGQKSNTRYMCQLPWRNYPPTSDAHAAAVLALCHLIECAGGTFYTFTFDASQLYLPSNATIIKHEDQIIKNIRKFACAWSQDVRKFDHELEPRIRNFLHGMECSRNIDECIIIDKLCVFSDIGDIDNNSMDKIVISAYLTIALPKQ